MISDIGAMDWVGIAAFLGMIGGGIRWAWTEVRKARRAELEEAANTAVERERAEQYRLQSTATIEAKNDELTSKDEQLSERMAFIRRQQETIETQQATIEDQQSAITALAESYRVLSEGMSAP